MVKVNPLSSDRGALIRNGPKADETTMHITLKELNVFLAAYECRNLSRAAKKLCITPSAASQALKELEFLLGAELFERNSSGLIPRASAERLLPHATLIRKKAQEIEAIFSEESRGLSGRLVIGSNRLCGIYILARRLPGMRMRHPAVDAVLQIEDNAAVEEGVVQNKMDVGFIDRPPTDPSLEYFACFRDDLALLASPKSPFIGMDIPAEDFRYASFVLDQEETLRRESIEWLRRQGGVPEHVLLMNAMGAIKRATMIGLGLCVLPILTCHEELARGDVIELRKNVKPLGYEKLTYVVFRPKRAKALRELFFSECDIHPLEGLRADVGSHQSA